MTAQEIEISKLAVTAVVTLVVGVATLFIQRSQRDIAAQQARTALAAKSVAQAKLNLDLFEERYALFQVVWGFLSEATQTKAPEGPGLYPEFTNLIPKVQFLFGTAIATYVREVHRKRLDLDLVNRRLMTMPYVPEEESKLMTELHSWFFDEASNCFKRFGEYLDFSAWRADPLELAHAGVGA